MAIVAVLRSKNKNLKINDTNTMSHVLNFVSWKYDFLF